MKVDASDQQPSDESVLQTYIAKLERHQGLSSEVPEDVEERMDDVHKATNENFNVVLTIIDACELRKWLQENTLDRREEFEETYTSDMLKGTKRKVPDVPDVEMLDSVVEATLSDLRALLRTWTKTPSETPLTPSSEKSSTAQRR